jgi:hypothetical protein
VTQNKVVTDWMEHDSAPPDLPALVGQVQATAGRYGLTSREEEHLAGLNLVRTAEQSFKGG